MLKRDFGLCQPCRRCGLVAIATAVDHVVSKAKAAMLRWSRALIDSESNLQAICKPCHDAKTEEEQGKDEAGEEGSRAGGWPV